MAIYLDSNNKKNVVGEVIEKLARGSKSALIASPYVSGKQAEKLVNETKSLKLLCNARSPATDPNLLQCLLKKKNIEIRSFSELHAKVYCFDEGAVIASANATPNGLGDGLIEAGCSVVTLEDIEQIRVWFESMWISGKCEDVKNFSPDLWKELESKRRLASQEGGRKDQKLSDLIRARVPLKDLAFIFYEEVDDAPSQEHVEESATQSELQGIPRSFGNWDFWIEGRDYNEDSKRIDPILKTYFDFKCIEYRVKESPFTKVYKRPGRVSKLLDRSIKHRYGKDELCLTLYRTDVPEVEMTPDSEVAAIINESLASNKDGWSRYFNSPEGKSGFCSGEKLYELLYPNREEQQSFAGCSLLPIEVSE